MQTALADFIKNTAEGKHADSILRACVHCGFCTATCPTYQLLGDELDGPRGRIYQIKQVLEGAAPTPTLRGHLDRCLSCRACETTCPSGVDYHHLLDIGRDQVEQQLPRPLHERLQRKSMVWLFSSAKRFAPVLAVARLVRPVLPVKFRHKITPACKAIPLEKIESQRRMLLLDGCVQPAIAPNINQAAKRVLGHLGIDLQSVSNTTCCGALPQHLSEKQKAQQMARQNIDAWYPQLKNGAEALVITASGCGAHIRDYGTLLANDPDYVEKAEFVADKAIDIVQALAKQDLKQLTLKPSAQGTAVHTPCTLQHALGLNGEVEKLLTELGYSLRDVSEGHLCCGSAGTYSITQAKLSGKLRERKLNALKINKPARIVTANIGCLGHLHEDEGIPVMHWINLIEEDLVK